MPASMMPIQSQDIRRYISRCSVCESITQLIAVHSQTSEMPDCPHNWESVWTGYSFLMVSVAF